MPPRPSGAPLSRSNSSLGAPAHGVRRQGSKASLRSVSSGGGGSRREREKSPALIDNGTDSRRGGTSHDDMLNSARWSTTSNSALSDTSSTVSAAHSRSSTPRTSTRYRDHILPQTLYHILHLTPILAYICSLLPRPANINVYTQLAPVFWFRRSRRHTSPSSRGNAGFGSVHVSGDTV